MLPTWAWRPTLAWVARGPLKVARECDPGMRQEFASESKPKTGSNASVSLTKRTQFNRGAGKSLNIVFSRGLRAARTGGVVAAIPFACHTVRRRQRKNLLPINPPLGFSLGTVTTTETLSTEATPEHHRGCFNAPKFPLTPTPTRHPRLRSGISASTPSPNRDRKTLSGDYETPSRNPSLRRVYAQRTSARDTQCRFSASVTFALLLDQRIWRSAFCFTRCVGVEL